MNEPILSETSLLVFALDASGPPLQAIQDTLNTLEVPAELGVELAGAASLEERMEPDWEAAFVRWTEPERHEVLLLVRHLTGQDEEADVALASTLRLLDSAPLEAGTLLLREALPRTRALFVCQLLPPLLADDDHPAWNALDAILRTLAVHSGGIIYAEAEGFYDADGEPLLTETG